MRHTYKVRAPCVQVHNRYVHVCAHRRSEPASPLSHVHVQLYRTLYRCDLSQISSNRMQGGVHFQFTAPPVAAAAPHVQLKSAGLTSQKHRCLIWVGARHVVNPEQDVATHHTSSMSETLRVEIRHDHTNLFFYRLESVHDTRSRMRVRTVSGAWQVTSGGRASLYSDHVGLLLFYDLHRNELLRLSSKKLVLGRGSLGGLAGLVTFGNPLCRSCAHGPRTHHGVEFAVRLTGRGHVRVSRLTFAMRAWPSEHATRNLMI